MIVFITGGSRGIGKAIRTIYENNGHYVIAPTRSELDLSSVDSVNRYAELHKNDDIDILINNAGINPLNYIDSVNDEDLAQCLQVNLASPAMLARGLISHMKHNRNGYIVNIGSVWGVVSKEKRGVYSMTKNGIHGLTNTLAVELGKYNILVNTVCPGFTNTELTSRNLSETDKRMLLENVPLGRLAEPHEIAQTVYWLAGGGNSYITGQKIIIDGGYTAI